MPKAVLGILAVVAVAGWATAFVFFTKSEDLGGELETSEVEREKLAEDLELAQNESKKHIKAASRLDEIGQKLGAAKDKVASYERLIQAKQDELVVVIDELATLESNLSERKAQVLRTEAEELEGKAEPNQSEPLAEPESESQTLPEAEPSAAEPEPQVMSEAEPSAAEPEPQAMSEAEPSAAEPEETDRVAEARRRFQIVDQDGDGKIDEFEFKMNSIKLLGLIDANDDGFVTIEETLLSPERFKVFDSDGDGKISSVEFTRAFPKIDTNRQGFITFEEYLASIQAASN